jgi:hypothetical protein
MIAPSGLSMRLSEKAGVVVMTLASVSNVARRRLACWPFSDLFVTADERLVRVGGSAR